MPRQSRKTSAPVAARRPKTRRDAAMPHYDAPAHVPRSVLHQVLAMRRCIVAEDGSAVSNNQRWLEVLKDSSKLIPPDTPFDDWALRLVTEDGRHWLVEVKEVKL